MASKSKLAMSEFLGEKGLQFASSLNSPPDGLIQEVWPSETLTNIPLHKGMQAKKSMRLVNRCFMVFLNNRGGIYISISKTVGAALQTSSTFENRVNPVLFKLFHRKSRGGKSSAYLEKYEGKKRGRSQYCSARFLKLVFWHSS